MDDELTLDDISDWMDEHKEELQEQEDYIHNLTKITALCGCVLSDIKIKFCPECHSEIKKAVNHDLSLW